MTRLLALATIFASAISAVNAAGYGSGSSSGSGWSSGSGSSSGSGWSSGSGSGSGSSNVQASTGSSGVIVISSNAGGSSSSQNWNSPMGSPGATHQITVGGDAGDVYSPPTIAAAVGDLVVFTFQHENHTATQSSFGTPCIKLSNGVDSGFMPNPSNSVSPPPTMTFQVTATTPIWMYCRQTGHCGKGMVFSINPTQAKTQAEFMAAAIAQNGTSSSSYSGSGSGSSGSSSYGSSGSGSSGSSSWGSSAAAASAAATPAASVASGSGYTGTGAACDCSCLCGTNAFPAGAGIGAVGGLGGELSMVQAARKRHLYA